MNSPTPAPRLFYGPDGLRAGWSLLLFAALAAVIFFILAGIAQGAHLLTHALHQPPAALAVVVPEAVGSLSLLSAAFAMSRIERRPFACYGLAPSRLPLHLLAGAAWGVTLLSLLVAILWLTRHLVFDSVLLRGPAILTHALAWLLAFALVGLQEEFLTRGYIQFTLTRGLAGFIRALAPSTSPARTHALAFWTAALLFSAGFFMAGHLFNSGETPAGILAVGLVGITFAFSLWRTGTLWWAIGFHATWDWAQSFLYGVPDSGTIVQNRLLATHPAGSTLLSGGSTGPEGSLFILPILLFACIVIHLTLPGPNPAAVTLNRPHEHL